MCGRYLLDIDIENLEEIYRIVNRGQIDVGLSGHAPGPWVVYPTQSAPVVIGHIGGPRLGLMKWGYHLNTIKGPIINTRIETLDGGKAFYKSALQNRRCLIPASAYYEWRSQAAPKVPFTIAPPRGQTLSMAGLYYKHFIDAEQKQVEWRFSVVTRPANPQINPIHDRMPLLLSQDQSKSWLDPSWSSDLLFSWTSLDQTLSIFPEICDAHGNPIQKDGGQMTLENFF